MARPTKFTRELGVAACNFAKQGASKHAVAGMIGVAPQTLLNWLAGEIESIDEDEHAAFLESYARAEAEDEQLHVGVIRETDDWKARAWLLERSRAHWRMPKDETQHEHAAPPTIVVQLPPQQAQEPKQ